MKDNVQRIRKSLTTIELEDGEKFPAKPDYRKMLREAEEVEYEIRKMIRLIKDIGDL